MEFITRKEALAILKERTGREFTMGIFSKRLRRDRVWCYSNRVCTEDIENFLAERGKLMARTKEEITLGRVRRLLLAMGEHNTTLKNLIALLAAEPEVVKSLESARGGLNWTFMGLLAAQRKLMEAEKKAEPVAANPEISECVNA